MMSSYINAAINNSPVITAPAAADLAPVGGLAGLAVKFDGNGNFVLAGDGDAAVGILLSSTEDTVAAGDDLTAQVKDIGLMMAGATIVPGNEIAVGAAATAVVAAATKNILGYALTGASAGQAFQIQITKSGYKPAA